ncbi:MAG TPA: pyruvate kinase [Verrucomicrobiae bacterium]|nr:pyruvate kinase [Verrucomicrobiae bacterium]
MKLTEMVPNVPVTKFKRTKILVTIGPSCNSYEVIYDMIKAGANILRLNFSHGENEERLQQIKWIRKASQEYGKPVAILQDLQGPKIRLGDFDGIINVQTGQSVAFKYKTDYEQTGLIPTQYDLSKKVKRGERLYLYDGKVRTTVTSVKDGIVHAHVENDGILIKRKGINLPDTDFGGDIITEKDKKDVVFGSTQDFDYVALSFVQTADDIRQLKKMLRNLGSKAKVMTKFETGVAVQHMEEIVQESDAICIARGDLAVEVPLESVPVIQRQLIELGKRYATPTIIATQMMLSMVDQPEPTRAEVSDVATGVILGADSLWLSDETTIGKYPVEAVKVMKRIILYTQENIEAGKPLPFESGSNQEAISEAVLNLANMVNATAIVAETKSGATALEIASRRPARPIIAVTSDPRVAQQMALIYGTKSYVRPDSKYAASRLTDWLEEKKVLKKGDVIVTASGKYPGVVGTTDTIKVRVLE